MVKNSFVVGITGGSGSGKTHFLNELSKHFTHQEVCLLSQDHYYKPIDQQPRDKNGIENFDLPIAIDRENFISDLINLKSGRPINKKEYTFNRKDTQPKVMVLNPAPVIIAEGLFVQYFEEVAKELDLKIFVEAKVHLMQGRRIKRDQDERGYDLNDVLYRYENHVMPVYEKLIEPLKHEADFIIPNNQKVIVSAQVIAGFLKSLIQKA
jgi:uridine kinase